MIDLILARNLQNTIAIDGMIPWHCPEDLKRFKKITQHYKGMVMGRETFEQLPGILPNRVHIVVTRSPEEYSNLYANKKVLFYHPEQVKAIIKDKPGQYICIGGAFIANMFMPLVETAYITEMNCCDPKNIDLLKVTTFDYAFGDKFKIDYCMDHEDHIFTIWERELENA